MSKTAAHAPRAAAMPAAAPKRAAAKRSAPSSPARAASPPAARRSPWHWIRAVFSHHLRLRRGPRGMEVVLEPLKPATPAPVSAPKAPAGPDMRRELTRLLDAVPHSRQALRHLAAVETGLRKDAQGLFLLDVDLKQLQVALRQLASLGDEALRAPGLAALSTRLLDAIAEQEKRAEQANGAPMTSSFLVNEDQVDVAEVDVSRFEQLFEGAPGQGPKG